MIYIQTVFNLCIVREVHNYVIIDLISWTLCGFCDFYYCISVLFTWYLMLRTMNITFFIYKETSKPFFSQLFPFRSVSMVVLGWSPQANLSLHLHWPQATHPSDISFQECLLPVLIPADFSSQIPAWALIAFLACVLCIDQCHQWVGYTWVCGKDYNGAILSSVAPKAVSCMSSEISVWSLTQHLNCR